MLDAPTKPCLRPVEWPDATRNDQLVRAEDFRDAIAVEFPLVEHEPFLCMGQLDGGVNIWYWKAH